MKKLLATILLLAGTLIAQTTDLNPRTMQNGSNLGTPTTLVLTNATGLPITTGVSGLATGIATFLAAPTSANLLATMTTSTGTGLAVFGTSPTLISPILGTPTSVTLTNATGLPVSTGISGFGIGIATFLGTPSGANLATALTSALPATKGGTGLTSLGTGVPAALGNAVDIAGGLCTVSGGVCAGGGGSTTATSIKTALAVTDSGSANAYVGCDANSTAPVDGLMVVLKPAHDNTGGSTYNHCAAGAKPIQTAYGATMLSGSIRADGAGSPSGVLLRYSTAANAGNGAWQNLTLGQVQLAPQTTANYGQFPRADGAGLTQWANPLNPGDGRRTSLVECNGRSWDLSNTALLGALFSIDHTANLLTGSASPGAGSQLPGCTITSGATSGNYVAYNIFGDDALFATGRSLQFDTTIALGSTASTRNWIGLSACSAATDAGSATPCTTGFLGFRYDTGASDTSWRCIVATASATNVDSSVAPSTNQVHLKFIADDTNNAVHFYIDGTEVCTATAVTNYPAATFLTWHLTETTLTSASKSLTMAYQWIQGDK